MEYLSSEMTYPFVLEISTLVGWIYVPPALMQMTQVTVDPRSADVKVSICFLPLRAKIFGLFDGMT